MSTADSPQSPEPAPEGVSFGAAVRSVTPDVARDRGLPAAFGVEVGHVRPGTPAEAAGVLPGDIIFEVGAYTLHSGADQFSQAVAARRPGDAMVLTVRRDGARHRLTVSF